MPNREHLEILLQGVEPWNEWRKANSHDVWVADLSEVSLGGADLKGAYFLRTDLRESDFRDADLTEAYFGGSNVVGANFKDFLDADLRGADFSWADLARTIFNNTDLRGANFYQALIGSSIFAGCDLTDAIELESCRHTRQSFIDPTTLINSGRLPLPFLRGCGLSDAFITYISSFREEPIQFYSCFISYSSKDHDFADRLYSDLQNRGVRCWFAPEDLKIGDRFRDRIDESIRLHDKLLLILSENSVASPWVSDEVEAAIEREHREGRTVLFPIKIDDAVIESEQAWAATIRRTKHIGDFTGWKDHDLYRKAFDRLVRDLKAGEAKP